MRRQTRLAANEDTASYNEASYCGEGEADIRILLTAMRRSRRSAFKRFRARREEVSIKDSERASKDKLRARGRDAGHPGGATLLSRRVHPVGDWGHVPRGERSVRNS